MRRLVTRYNKIRSNGTMKETWNLALPNMLTNLALHVFGLTDLFFVGWLGREAIAAVSVGGFFITLIFTAVIAISTGTLALASRAVGAEDTEKLQHVAGQSLLLSQVAGILMTLLLWPLIPPLLSMIGAEGDVSRQAINYSHIVVLGAFAYLGQITSNALFRSTGDSRTPLRLVTTSVLINVVLDPILIFGWFGVPAMGVNGSALATVLARLLALSMALRVMLRPGSKLRPRFSRPDFPLLRKLLSIGAGGTVQLVIRNGVNFYLVHLAAGFGTAVLAAYGVVLRIHFMLIMTGFGLALASATLIGQRIGAGHREESEDPAWAALFMFEVLIILVSLPLFFLAPWIVGAFSDGLAVTTPATLFLRIFIPFYPIWAMGLIFGRSMMGAGDTWRPTAVQFIVQAVLRIPLAWLFSHPELLGAPGIILAIGLTDAMGGLMTTWLFRRGWWKTVKL